MENKDKNNSFLKEITKQYWSKTYGVFLTPFLHLSNFLGYLITLSPVALFYFELKIILKIDGVIACALIFTRVYIVFLHNQIQKTIEKIEMD